MPSPAMARRPNPNTAMSYDITFCDPRTNEPICKPDGLLDLGFANDRRTTMDRMYTSPTYNYGAIFSKFGINPKHDLNGLPAAVVAAKLLEAIPKMADDIADDVWAATEGNAKRVALRLLAWAALAGPEAILREDS